MGGYNGDNIPAITATLGFFSDIKIDNEGNLLIADPNNHRVRKVDLSTGLISTIAGTGVAGYNGDNIAATSSQLNWPGFIAVNADGDVFINDYLNNRIRKISKTTGLITTFAGTGTDGFSGDGGPATLAELNNSEGIAVDGDGNLIIADNGNHRVRKVNANGVISTIGGTGNNSFGGDGGPALAADISGIYGIGVDDSGNVYLACMNQARIRKIDISNNIITTVAGNGSVGAGGDGLPATAAQLRFPFGVSVDKAGNIYIADRDNHKIRKVSSTGIISTVVGTGVAGFSGDGGLAINAQLKYPSGVSLDSCGNLFIADKENKRVRKVTLNDTCGLLKVKPAFNTGSSLSIYPNPSYSRLNISSVEKVKEVLVIDLTGREVLRQSSNSSNLTLDISHLSSGVYFVRITDERGRSLTKKVVKE